MDRDAFGSYSAVSHWKHPCLLDHRLATRGCVMTDGTNSFTLWGSTLASWERFAITASVLAEDPRPLRLGHM
jgi:hypothetical protein